MRILVTGARSWADERAIRSALSSVWPVGINAAQMTLVHGECPLGADKIAAAIADVWGWKLDPHPARWAKHGGCSCRPDVRKHCGFAGFRRNAEMVALGADVCLAFLAECSKASCRKPRPHDSHGATHCADLAEKAGIRTVRFVADAQRQALGAASDAGGEADREAISA